MIELAYPWALAALVSIPIIVILHSLRPARRTVVVSSITFWQEAVREQRRGLGLRKLLRNLSLLLLLLFALVLSLGLASPSAVTRSADRSDSVLVIDVSASMQTGTDGGTRLEGAKRIAADRIRDLPDDAHMLIMTTGRTPVLRTGFESRKDALQARLDAIEPTDEAGQPHDALELALSLLRDRERGRVHFLTDGAFDGSIDLGASNIEVTQVGEAKPNIAITRFDVRPEIGAQDRFEVLLTVRNYTDEPVSVPASVTLDRSLLFEQAVALPAQGKQAIVRRFEGRAFGEVVARIAGDDGLAADDRAFAVMSADESLDILMLGPDSYYLESALAALPGVSVERRELVQPEALEQQAGTHDVVVLNRADAPSLPPGNYLLIDSVPAQFPFRTAGRVMHPVITGKGTSPLVRDIDLTGIRINAARRVAGEADAAGLQRLFWSDETPLALSLIYGDVRAVYVGFDLSQSTFALRAAFPLFLDESLSWLRPRRSRFARTQLAAGEPHTLSLPAHTTELIMRMPSGDGLIHPVRGGTLEFNDTSTAGVYRYTADEVRRFFAVNLTDESESDIRPRATATAAPEAAASPAASGLLTVALWPYLAIGGICLLVLEWAVWCSGRHLA